MNQSASTEAAELTIVLVGEEPGRYSVDLRLWLAGEALHLTSTQRGVASFNLPYLQSLQERPDDYGRALGASLFASSVVQEGLAQSRRATQRRAMPLRVLVRLGQSTDDLHGLHWEWLRDPLDDTPLPAEQCITTDAPPPAAPVAGESAPLEGAAPPATKPRQWMTLLMLTGGLLLILLSFCPLFLSILAWLQPDDPINRGQRAIAPLFLCMTLLLLMPGGWLLFFAYQRDQQHRTVQARYTDDWS
ncbi:MAG: hypothetical protein HC876_20875 [Chloroflexaceae bacterium]|nr:hypothetical protein [Chloroflexaceae bacterium]